MSLFNNDCAALSSGKKSYVVMTATIQETTKYLNEKQSVTNVEHLNNKPRPPLSLSYSSVPFSSTATSDLTAALLESVAFAAVPVIVNNVLMFTTKTLYGIFLTTASHT